MTRPVLIIRPEPGNAASCERAAALGLEALAWPLFQVRPLNWSVPDAATFDALLLTSANAIRHGGTGLASLRSLPVWAVGRATAAAASTAGFNVEREGTKDVDVLLKDARDERLLHLAGRETVPVLLSANISRVIVYGSDAVEPGLEFAAVLKREPIVLLHSSRAAQHFASHCTERHAIALVTISDVVAEAAGSGWERVAIASQSSDEAMLDTARRLAPVS